MRDDGLEGDDVAGTAVFSAPLGFVHVQPDGQIRRLSDSALIGDDVYNADVAGQTVAHGITAGHDWSFAVQVQNDGMRNEDISVAVMTEVGRHRSPFATSWAGSTSRPT